MVESGKERQYSVKNAQRFAFVCLVDHRELDERAQYLNLREVLANEKHCHILYKSKRTQNNSKGKPAQEDLSCEKLSNVVMC